MHGVTQLDEPPSIQPPHDLFNDPTPGDLDNNPPLQPKGSSTPQLDKVDKAAPDAPQEQQALPPDPDPVPKHKARTRQVPTEPPRQSSHKGKVPTLPDNVYGDKPPAKVVKDVEQSCTWRKMIENQLGSSWDDKSHDLMIPGEFPEQADDPPITQRKKLLESEDEVEQQLLIRLAKEGGVKFLDLLLAKAVSPTDLGSPDTANI